MPIISDDIFHNDYRIYTWEITESKEELENMCKEASFDISLIKTIKLPKRAKEKLAELLILQHATGYNVELAHRENGAPYIVNEPINISITHSGNFVCIAFSSHKQIGIDIESHSDKVLRVRDRFLNEAEKSHISQQDLEMNLMAWTSKEAIYKATSISGIDFKESIRLNLPDKGQSLNGNSIINFSLHHHKIDNYLITVAIIAQN